MEAYHGARFFGQCTQACYLGLDSGPPRWRRDREFESVFLQRRVRLSQEPTFVGQEPRLSARVCPAAFPVRSTESRRGRQHRTNPQQYLCRAIFQYRISGDAVATSYRVKVARPVPNQVGLPPGSEMPVDLASWDRAQAKPSTVR